LDIVLAEFVIKKIKKGKKNRIKKAHLKEKGWVDKEVIKHLINLGNGSGAASPRVKHHRVLVSFLQHLILHKLTTNNKDIVIQSCKAVAMFLMMIH